MSNEKSIPAAAKDDDDMDRLARQMLLDEAKRNKIRAETQGALGWQKPNLTTNRKFLRNTLISNAVHNIHQNEQRNKSMMKRKQDDYKSQRKRSSSSPPQPSSSSLSSRKKRHDNDDDDELSLKRTKKDK